MFFKTFTPLSPLELEDVKKAVQEAELNTRAEIVPYLVAQSDKYPEAFYRCLMTCLSLGLLIAALVWQFYMDWSSDIFNALFSGWGMGLWMMSWALFSFFLYRIPRIKRFFIGRGALKSRVHNRAMRAFVEENVVDTQERIGILLFVSFFEHRIEVIADKGINSVVPEDTWREVVTLIKEGVKSNNVGGGIVNAIKLCGELLQQNAFEIRSDDQNELSNEIRIRKS